MSLILNIDTAVQSASVCLSRSETVLAARVNPVERDAASWLHLAMQEVLTETGFRPKDLAAIAVSAGPGSYTGLRVGMAAAKGLCYALSAPLITINTLQFMAAAAVESASTALLCPMIDARRMEVFTALYNTALDEVMAPTNLILDETSFGEWLQNGPVVFFGNGSDKATPLLQHPNAGFLSIKATATDMVGLSAKKFDAKQFSDLAYAEPFYGKDFHSSSFKKFY